MPRPTPWTYVFAAAALSLAACRLNYSADPALGELSTGNVAGVGTKGGEGAAGGGPSAGGAPDAGGVSDTGGMSDTGGTSAGGIVTMGGASESGGATTGAAGDGTSGTATGGASGAGGSSGGGTGSGGMGTGEPTGIVEAGEALTTQYGGDGGSVFSDRCPAGQALIGFAGYADAKPGEQWIDRLQGVCGTLSLTGSGSGPYAVSIGAGITLPVRGISGKKKFSIGCPTDTMIIGVEGRSGLYFDQVTLYCAPLQVTGTTGSYVLSLGAFTVAGPAGGDGGSAFARTDCPAGWIANGMEGRSGDFVDKVGLACTEPMLTY